MQQLGGQLPVLLRLREHGHVLRDKREIYKTITLTGSLVARTGSWPCAAALPPAAGSSPTTRTWTRPAKPVEENYQSIPLKGSLVARTGSWPRTAAWRPAAGSSPIPRTWTRPAGSVGDLSVNNVESITDPDV